jgi:hypothetical protein
MLVASIITLSVFSGVETSAVVIRNIGTYFPLSSNRLTFKATAFEARNNATYRVKIKADLGTPASFFDRTFLPPTTEKTLTVTVTKNPDDNGKYVPTFRGFDINTIIGIISGFKIRGFES